MLQWGKGSSFHVFQEAISKVAMEKYGHAGKMFETNVKYVPPLPLKKDYTIAGLDAAENTLMYNEAIKSYTKQIQDMNMNAPKIYGFIEQYLSAESMDEIKQHKDYAVFNVEKNPVARERFDGTCKAYEEHKNAALAKEDMAMDFFNGLDSARYMQFKVDINNNMTLNDTLRHI
mmetsp:Transcript_26702/g.38279  ORF Transcript_26702/g.38279 Transcript_26702/m.38279 type:complete len:174 (-) Transcript_26702:645-1166(-)